MPLPPCVSALASLQPTYTSLPSTLRESPSPSPIPLSFPPSANTFFPSFHLGRFVFPLLTPQRTHPPYYTRDRSCNPFLFMASPPFQKWFPSKLKNCFPKNPGNLTTWIWCTTKQPLQLLSQSSLWRGEMGGLSRNSIWIPLFN